MSGSGLSEGGVQRMHDVLAGHVERGEIPGLVALVSRHDDLHVDVLGRLTLAGTAPMRRDAIFRIASITKPVVAAAAMILLEECRMRLDEPIERWLPELANRRVLRTLASALDDTVPARRAITVRDVLSSTMGFGSVMAMPGTYPIQQRIRDDHIGGDGPLLPADYPAPDEWLRRLGALPWLAHPGERFMYQVSMDVLGLLIARVAGQPLGAFLRERVFEPLGMTDTAFHVPPEKHDRLPDFVRQDHERGALAMFDPADGSAFAAAPAFESGGGGLVGTIDDYFAFYRMLLRGGEPILSRPSVTFMMSDRLTPAQREGAEIFFGTHSSWGYGGAVDLARHDPFHNPGRYGWTGGFGTTAYIDPAEGLIGILFTQRLMDSPEPPAVMVDFWTTAYAAIR